MHLEHAAVLGAGGIARLQETRGPITAAQVREWCAQPDTQITVQPVLDLAEHIHVGSYQASARLKLQTQLRDGTCVFAFCFRPAEDCDCEHRVPHEDGGPTCSCNQAPCCRRHHRAKTTGGWSYVTVEPGVYLWRSPLGYQFLRDHSGTVDVTPDPERLRLAHELPPPLRRTLTTPPHTPLTRGERGSRRANGGMVGRAVLVRGLGHALAGYADVAVKLSSTSSNRASTSSASWSELSTVMVNDALMSPRVNSKK